MVEVRQQSDLFAARHVVREPNNPYSRPMETVTESGVRRYLRLPYRIVLSRDDADDATPWRAVVEELPGCEVRGPTPGDVATRVPAALAEWVAAAQAGGREVPEPRDARAYSGKTLLRMSRSLHSDLAQAAERDQVSLNAYINYILATAVQQPAPAWEAERAAEPAPDTERLQRLLALAVAANVAVAVIAAVAIAVLLVG